MAKTPKKNQKNNKSKNNVNDVRGVRAICRQGRRPQIVNHFFGRPMGK